MTRTRFLIVIAVAAALYELFPRYAALIQAATIALAILYLATRLLTIYPARFREKRRLAALAESDDLAFRQYKAELDDIRAKYDPDRAPDHLSPEYSSAIDALHDKYRDMLGRKFGER